MQHRLRWIRWFGGLDGWQRGDLPSERRRRRGAKIDCCQNRTRLIDLREALNKFKMEAASEVGVNLKQGYNGDLTSREAGSVGGQMVKKMIQAYENGMQ